MSDINMYDLFFRDRQGIESDIYGISPLSSKDVLFETLQSIKEKQPSYIKELIRAEDNVDFTTDFRVIDKDEYLFKSSFSHTGTLISFPEDRLLFHIKDYSLYSKDELFSLEVFVNGKELAKHSYNVKTALGSKRIYIKSEFVEVNDVVSFVVRKKYNNESVYKYTQIQEDEDNFVFLVDTDDIGRFYSNLDFLTLFKKGLLSNEFVSLERNVDYVLEELDIENRVQVTMLTKVYANEVLLLMNILCDFDINIDLADLNLTDDEYMNSPLLQINLVKEIEILNTKLPYPVESLHQLDVFLNGLKLIGGQDYNLESGAEFGSSPIIKFSGIPFNKSYIKVRPRFYETALNIHHILPSMTLDGALDVRDAKFPLSDDYVEVYLGRKRVAAIDKYIIADSIVKIDNQHTLGLFEYRTNVLPTPRLKELLEGYEENKSSEAKLVDMMGYDDFMTMYGNNNDLLTNDDIDALEEVFASTIESVEIYSNKTSVIEGTSDIEFHVLGHYTSGDITEITDLCDISVYNKHQIGIQEVTVEYRFGSLVLRDSMYIEVIPKVTTSIRIELTDNFIDKNDAIQYSVWAKFNDFSEKNITDHTDRGLVMSIPSTADYGVVSISAEYMDEWTEEVFTDTAQLSIVEETFRVMESIEIIPSKSVTDGVENVELNIYATYSDKIIKSIGHLATVSDFDPTLNTVQRITIDVVDNDGTNYQFVKNIKLFNDENTARNAYYDEGIITIKDYTYNSDYLTYKVRNADTSIYYTVGLTDVYDEAIHFDFIEPNSVAIVEFYNDSEVKVDELLYVMKSLNGEGEVS